MQSKDLEVLNEMPFLFWAKDEQGRYVWGNQAIRDMAKTELVGKTDYELPWAEDADALQAVDKQVLETGEPRFLHEHVTKPSKKTLNVCKWAGKLDGKQHCFGISFVIT